MAGLVGALRGASRGVLLLLFAILFPAVAWLAAVLLEGALGLGFATLFAGVLALELFLGLCALFGTASEIQREHARSVEEAPPR